MWENHFQKVHCIYVGHERKERLSEQRTETNNKANYTANCYRKHNCCIADNLHITEVD